MTSHRTIARIAQPLAAASCVLALSLAGCATPPRPLAEGHPATDCATFLQGSWSFGESWDTIQGGSAMGHPVGQGEVLTLQPDGTYITVLTIYAGNVPSESRTEGRWSAREGQAHGRCVLTLEGEADTSYSGEYEILNRADIRIGNRTASRAGRSSRAAD